MPSQISTGGLRRPMSVAMTILSHTGHVLLELSLVAWLGGLVYVCFVLPPAPDQGALPPVHVRMLGLMRFRVFGAICLGVLLVLGGLVPLFLAKAGWWGWVAAILRLLLLGACVVSTLQLHRFVDRALATGNADPLPMICQEDPTQVDKMLRQVNKICRSLVFFGLGVLVLLALVPPF